MTRFASYADRMALESEMPWSARKVPATMHDFLAAAAEKWGDRPALSFQILSEPASRAETLTWSALLGRARQAANLFRELGVGEGDTVAYLLPNCTEAVVALLGGTMAGIVNPINPLLEPEQIASILRETNAKVLVTLKAFPRTDVAQKAGEAVQFAPGVKAVLEVDLGRYLAPPQSWLVRLARPKNPRQHRAAVDDFNAACARQPADRLTFDDPKQDRVAAYFHTGGTTGMPKVAQHRVGGMIYNGWIGATLLFRETDVLLCPLPLFHVFAAYPILMSCIASGAHVVLPTPAGYRGEGVFDNFWRLIERWKVSFVITVPTAVSALMQRPVNADISSLNSAISGSAPLPVELYNRFKAATGVEIAEGYGLTEATCLVSCNPFEGTKKVGSVGIPFPYTDVKILQIGSDGQVVRSCGVDEVGEICIASPGVYHQNTYRDPAKNAGLFAELTYLRTGDLGRLDADGYLWITGRSKDLIIRGGHNIDPAEIEEAMLSHPAVAFAGAIGQPDAFAGELPCVYIELTKGAVTTVEALADHARAHIRERAAVPKYIEILPELPKTAVGKVLKNELRKSAIARVYGAVLEQAGLNARVADVYEHKQRGLVARIARTGELDEAELGRRLGELPRPWEWAD